MSLLVLCALPASGGIPEPSDGLLQCSKGIRAVVDFGCTSSEDFPNGEYDDALARAFALSGENGVSKWGNRAYRHDLDGDSQPEHLVPLWCGATGNCSWAVLGSKPEQLLGVIWGERLYLYRSNPRGSHVCGHSTAGAGEGYLQRFDIASGQYKETGAMRLDEASNDRVLSKWGKPHCSKKAP